MGAESEILLAIVIIIVITFLVDGLKLLFGIFSKSPQPKYTFDPSVVTVIIPVYNGQDSILETLKATTKIFSQNQIIVANDGSTDKTSEIVTQNFPQIKLTNLSHSGKTKAVQTVLEQVKTPYVLVLDDDTILSKDFKCPTSLMDKECTAVAFNVKPKIENFNFLLFLQFHEYLKAMQIGRKSHNLTKSVLCISGAVGLFKTGKLKEILKLHSNVFQGEDLENTLLELLLGGKIIWVNETAFTSCPPSLRTLAKQRIINWWPGLYRNLPLLFRVFRKKGASRRLKWEIGYEIFNILACPLKLFSLVVMIIFQLWLLLGIFYLLYLVLEVAAGLKIRKFYPQPLAWIWILYPGYGLLQILFYNLAWLYFIWKWLIKREWKLESKFKTGNLSPVLFFNYDFHTISKALWHFLLQSPGHHY